MRDTWPPMVRPVSEFTTSNSVSPMVQLIPKFGALAWFRGSAEVTKARRGLFKWYGGGRPWMDFSIRPHTARYMCSGCSKLPSTIECRYTGSIMEDNREPCIPTMFQRAILSEHDIVNRRWPYKKLLYNNNINKLNVLKRLSGEFGLPAIRHPTFVFHHCFSLESSLHRTRFWYAIGRELFCWLMIISCMIRCRHCKNEYEKYNY